MLKKIFFIAFIFLLTSCVSSKRVGDKDRIRSDANIAIISLFNERLGGYGYYLFDSQQFNSEVNWDINNHTANAMQNFLKKDNFFKNTKIYHVDNFKEKITIPELIQNINKKTNNTPNYYLILIPRSTKNDVTETSLKDHTNYETNSVFDLIIIPIELAILGIKHNYIKYKNFDVPNEAIYSSLEEYISSTIKITSGKFVPNTQRSSCNISFDLLLIDVKKNQLIGFNKNNIVKHLPNYYSWNIFNSFSNFTPQEKNEIKQECFKILDESIEYNLKRIGIVHYNDNDKVYLE